jgi:hypothetical protein
MNSCGLKYVGILSVTVYKKEYCTFFFVDCYELVIGNARTKQHRGSKDLFVT